ncbi:MAG: hypothetical protein JWM19_5766 [Actinomycetia bacterium]|nr:hypothetical protein [Actinomycetes bacterium]
MAGIMLFGSVPSPPKNPKSWNSTHTARQNTTPAITAIRPKRTTRTASPAGVPATIASAPNARPSTASTITTARFTANAFPAVNVPKFATRRAMACGCGVCAIVATVLASGPLLLPRQKPEALTEHPDRQPPHQRGRRVLRIGFGVLWLFDGLLQAQPQMAAGLPSQVIAPAVQGSPAWVLRLVNWGEIAWAYHPVQSAAAALWIQAGIGLWLLVAPRGRWSRLAGAVSRLGQRHPSASGSGNPVTRGPRRARAGGWHQPRSVPGAGARQGMRPRPSGRSG